MATTLEDLERRVAALEAANGHAEPTPAKSKLQALFPELRIADDVRVAVKASLDRSSAAAGVPETPPVSIEELHQIQLARGVDPNGTSAREGICAMREE